MQLMQIDCSLPGALFNFKSPVQKSPSTVSQAEAHIQTPLFATVFHIFLMVLIKSVIKLNYVPAHQWNFYIFLELLTATYPSVQHSLQMKPSSSPKGQSVWKLHTWVGSMHSPEFSQWKNSPHSESVEVRSINHKCWKYAYIYL